MIVTIKKRVFRLYDRIFMVFHTKIIVFVDKIKLLGGMLGWSDDIVLP